MLPSFYGHYLNLNLLIHRYNLLSIKLQNYPTTIKLINNKVFPLLDTELLACCNEAISCNNMLFSVVTAGNREVLSGTDAVVISCKVTGLTAALQTVKWLKTDGGTDVTTGETGYTSNIGSLVGDSQTTTLTVASAQNTADSTYTCLITPAAQDDATEVSTVVTLNTFSK